jgi:hypothetical protein
VSRWVELTEQSILFRDLDAGRFHPRCVREARGVTQNIATLCVARDVAHALRDLDDRVLVAHVGEQLPVVPRRTGIEGVEHDA